MQRIVFLFIILLMYQQPAGPCAPAPPAGSKVTILDESAFIVWDPEKKEQHFIRRATFESDAADFGFLVPTPQRPQLSELPDEVFSVEHLMAPETVYDEETGIRPMFAVLEFFLLGSSRDTAGPPLGLPRSSVRVLERANVGGYDAVVLEADDPSALSGWLQQNGYPSSPELQAWFEPYVASQWKITAFKISGDQKAAKVSTSAVRMSFQTESPFFPYREPEAEMETRNRVLQILMLSPEKMEGKLGQNFSGEWAGETVWADKLDKAESSALLKQMKISLHEKSLWLINFEDRSTSRKGGEDLYFRKADPQSRVVPPPVVITRDARIPVPLDLLLVFAAIGFLFYRRKKRSL